MRDRIIEFKPKTKKIIDHIPWQFITDNSLSKIEQKSLVVLAIHEDQQGYLWLSTRKRGIVKYHPKTKKTVIYKGQLTENIDLKKSPV